MDTNLEYAFRVVKENDKLFSTVAAQKEDIERLLGIVYQLSDTIAERNRELAAERQRVQLYVNHIAADDREIARLRREISTTIPDSAWKYPSQWARFARI